MIFARIHAANVIRELGNIKGNLPSAAAETDATIAADVVAKARGRAAGLGSVHGHVMLGIGVGRPGTITLDGTRYPPIFGAEHGSVRYPQFPASRPGEDGYMVQPELRDADVVERYGEALEDELGL